MLLIVSKLKLFLAEVNLMIDKWFCVTLGFCGQSPSVAPRPGCHFSQIHNLWPDSLLGFKRLFWTIEIPFTEMRLCFGQALVQWEWLLTDFLVWSKRETYVQTVKCDKWHRSVCVCVCVCVCVSECIFLIVPWSFGWPLKMSSLLEFWKVYIYGKLIKIYLI